MRRLTPGERVVLREVGEPNEFAPAEAFESAIREGWGYWGRPPDRYWHVTEKGRSALAYDDIALLQEESGT